MKFLFLFLGFYILALSCIPCSDSKECNTNYEVTVSAGNNHQDHHHTEESCSPFCTCTCCAATIFYSQVHKVLVCKIAVPAKKYPLYQERNKAEAFNTIWQPPKIAA